ncbi:hypothetical protein V1478_011640 [Vespula squamosa]|uniref:Uncharacterized protein n=1 Tax=Vespula squamosa TaxID=30214 RepID=A0ABD2AF19_VESSQ
MAGVERSYLERSHGDKTSRISSREKGSVYRKGGGSRTSSKRFTNGSTISFVRCNPLVGSSGESIAPTWFPGILRGTRNGQAACMIIEEYPPLPIKPRQNPHQDTTHRFLNHLVLPKHRTSKFSRAAYLTADNENHPDSTRYELPSGSNCLATSLHSNQTAAGKREKEEI